jgi:hypothetical protein
MLSASAVGLERLQPRHRADARRSRCRGARLSISAASAASSRAEKPSRRCSTLYELPGTRRFEGHALATREAEAPVVIHEVLRGPAPDEEARRPPAKANVREAR